MNQYSIQIQWEITRAIVCIAAWWVLFYRLHRPEALWRRIVLFIAMPLLYVFWRVMEWDPNTRIVGKSVSWAAITVVLAFICGDLRRSLFTAFFYIGMEESIDATRSSMIATIFDRFFTRYSPAQYLQFNLQYLFVFVVVCFYYTVMKRYCGKPKVSSWLLCILPPLVTWAVMTYFIHVTDITDPILLEQGINIYSAGFCFGLSSILLNLGILYLYIRQMIIIDAQHMAMDISGAKPIWTHQDGLSANFCERYSLTDREKEIVEAMMQGKSNKDIADTVLISIRTVGNYLQSVYKKTGVPNRFALYSLIKGDPAA